jgi:hypothetical protein
MLSFEIVQSGTANAIQIYCDDDGLNVLIRGLERVRQHGHLHLRSPSNGGRELNEDTPFGREAIREVIVTKGAY